MDRFHLMSVFVAVAEEESFTGGRPPARYVAAGCHASHCDFEERLGIKLLTRTTRFVRTTDAGLSYLESSRRILAEAG